MKEKYNAILTCFFLFLSLFAMLELTNYYTSNVKAVTIHVGPSQTYTTIQEGIDAANPGDTVYVHASIYYENVIINKTINLIGENKDITIINGNGSSNCIFVNSVNYVNISGFTVKNGTFGVYINSSSNSNISGSLINNQTTGGIGLNHSNNNTIIDNFICDIINKSSGWKRLFGIYLNDSYENIIDTNRVYNLSAERFIYGFYLTSSSNNTIYSNYITNLTTANENAYGMYLLNCNNNTIDSNNIYEFNENDDSLGIYLFSSLYNNITSNHIYNMSANRNIYPIRLSVYSNYNYVTLNNIYNHTALLNPGCIFGIQLDDSFNNNISSNIINNLTSYHNILGIALFESSNNTISSNDICNSRTINLNIIGIELYLYSHNNTVISNYIHDFNAEGFAHGILIGYYSNNTRIISNVIHNISGNDTTWGIRSYMNQYPAFNNSFVGNNIKNVKIGIYFSGTKNNVLENQIYNATETGISVGWETHNNTIKSNFIENINGNDSKAYGIYLANADDNLFISNYISNVSSNNMDAYGIYLQTSSTNNTFINCSISNIKTHDFHLKDESHAIALNTTFDPQKVHFDDTISSLEVQWFMHVYVNDTDSEPASDAIIEIYNSTSDSVASGVTDLDGFLRWIPVTERIEKFGTNITQTPHNVSASKLGFTSYADPEPLMDMNNQVNITLYLEYPLHHIVITPSGPENYYVNDSRTYTVIGWNDAEETDMNLTWTPVWSVEHSTIATIDLDTGFFMAIDPGSSQINVTSSTPSGIYNTSDFSVEPWPLHHIVISPENQETYYIRDTQTYTAIGYNDASESQMNLTWTPVWSVDNTSIATIDPSTGYFMATALGNSAVNVTSTAPTGIYSISPFSVEPWSLHHIAINPIGPESYYIDDFRTYSVIGWNDANETQQNMSWTPIWSVDNSSVASINPSTGEFTTTALGNGVVNVTSTSSIGIFNMSAFIIKPWALHHIVITPSGSENYYIGDTRTYTAIGFNDAAETQMNSTWTPVWNVNDPSLASIDSVSGALEILAFGSSFVNVTDSILTGIYNSSLFTVHPWPLHHIKITPAGPENYYIGDTKAYSVTGWNDVQETQVNNSWVPVWNIDNISVAQINDSGYFTAISLGQSEINVTCSGYPSIFITSTFIVNPWPLHHISISPSQMQPIDIGDEITYSVVGWNDAAETQQNDTWSFAWTVEGGIGEIIGDGLEVTFKAKKSGEGSIQCYDETSNIYAISEIEVKEKDKDGTSIWPWILIVIIMIIVFLIILLFILHKKKQKNDGKSEQ